MKMTKGVAAILVAAVTVTVTGAVSGCAMTVDRSPTFPELTYRHLKPITLDIGSLEIVSEYRAPGTPPHVEHAMPDPPADAARRWARDRISGVGAADRGRFVVTDASVTETRLKTNEGLVGMFTTEQGSRFDGRLAVRFDIVEMSGKIAGRAEAEATRSVTLAENATLNERDKVLFELTEALMTDLNRSLEQAIRDHLPAYLR